VEPNGRLDAAGVADDGGDGVNRRAPARVAAHLIVGARDEPFLDALLASLEGAAQTLIVNDNSPDPSAHAAALARSAFARRGALVVDRTPFVDFSTARNACLQVHRRVDAGEWVAFVDADEVHGDAVAAIAANLPNVPREFDFVDGYTWHFFASPNWYTSIERRMSFFRFAPAVRWEGRVHEQLRGLTGRRIALPYVYAHYGHILPPRRYAEKGRQYSSLGQSGEIVPQDQLDTIDPAAYFKTTWPILLPFRQRHPSAAATTLAALRRELAEQFSAADALVAAHQPPARRALNALRALNYAFRWRARAVDPLARRLLS